MKVKYYIRVLYGLFLIEMVITDDNYNIYRLHGIIKAKSGDMYYADDLNDYGCWCGQNGQGQPLDELDRCCYRHKSCLDSVLSNGCSVDSRYYSINVCFKILFVCVDTDPCKQMHCLCDNELSDCLVNQKSKYNNKLKNVRYRYTC